MIRNDTELRAMDHEIASLRRRLDKTLTADLLEDRRALIEAEMIVNQIEGLQQEARAYTWMSQLGARATIIPPTERADQSAWTMPQSLFALRTAASLTQDDLASKLGTSQSQVARMEYELREDHSTRSITDWAAACHREPYLRFIGTDDLAESVLARLRFDAVTFDGFLPPNQLQERVRWLCRRLKWVYQASLITYCSEPAPNGGVTSAVDEPVGTVEASAGLIRPHGDMTHTFRSPNAAEAERGCGATSEILRPSSVGASKHPVFAVEHCEVATVVEAYLPRTNRLMALMVGFRHRDPADEILKAIVESCVALVGFFDDLESAARQAPKAPPRSAGQQWFYRQFASFVRSASKSDWATVKLIQKLHTKAECETVLVGLANPQDADKYWELVEAHLTHERRLVYLRPASRDEHGMRERFRERLRLRGEPEARIKECLDRVEEVPLPDEVYKHFRDRILFWGEYRVCFGYGWSPSEECGTSISDSSLDELADLVETHLPHVATWERRSPVVPSASHP